MEERLDILDETGRRTGTTRTKMHALTHRLWHKAAHIWVYNSEGEVLLQKRAKTKMSNPSLWDVSAAGHVSAGEGPKRAALRELYEELGIRANPKSLKKIMVRKSMADVKSRIKNLKEWEFQHVYIYRFEGPQSGLKLQEEEVDAVKFVSIEMLEKDLRNKRAIKKYVSHGAYYFDVLEKIRQALGKTRGRMSFNHKKREMWWGH